MKNLSNCKPSEFLRQSNRIRKLVAKWLDATQIMEIRKHAPQPLGDLSQLNDEERKAAKEDYERRLAEQRKVNASKILDAALEEHPDETLELLGLLCFVEPEDVDNHPTKEYLQAAKEMLGDESVIGFFISLVQLESGNSLS